MVWDKTKCAEGILAPDLNDEIRANWASLEAALDAFHYFATGGTQTGKHRQGSAIPYFQDSAPTARLDGNYFDSTDLGCIWIDTNASPDNQFNILTAADGAGTETWTPISTEVIAVLLASARVFAGTLGVTGNFAVNTGKFTVAAATGNTVVAGTLDVTGNIDPKTYEATNGGFLDEDDMVSDAANKVASQQSIKKYVDDQLNTKDFGTPANDDDDSQTMAKAHAYLANQDGFVTAFVAGGTAGNALSGYVDDDATPTNGSQVAVATIPSNSYAVSITFPVKTGRYFELDCASGTVTIWWHPIGTLVKCTDQD